MKDNRSIGKHLVREHIVHVHPSKTHPDGKAPEKYKHVYGLMQITGQTHQYLIGANKELKDYFFRFSTNELKKPSPNISAGIRWLFRKKQTAAARLHREATWEETVEEYKAILEKRIHGKPYNPKPMEDFREYYKLLQGMQDENLS